MMRPFGLDPRKLKVFYGVVPLVTVVGSFVTAAAALSLYFLLTKNDVWIRTHTCQISEVPADWNKMVIKAPERHAKVELGVE